jgi:putative heme-binding domain-containing protein
MMRLLVAAAILAAAAPQLQNPRRGDPEAIRQGAAIYRERCAECHGADAKGVRGPDLTGLWTSDGADQRVFQTIRAGVPGSIMPPTSAPDAEIWAVAAYLRSLGPSSAPAAATSGSSASGGRTFWRLCGDCHRVGRFGGRLGPDLSTVGARRSKAQLAAAIREPGGSVAAGYEVVTLVTRDGERIRGVRKGEDAFSIQIMDTRERLQGYLKADLREVIREPGSLMPRFDRDRLSDGELDDLLAFLAGLDSDEAAARAHP